MKKIKLLLFMAVAVFALNSCTDENEPQNTPYVTFEASSLDVVFDQGTSTTKEVAIYAGNITSNDRTINVSVVDGSTNVDPAAYTVPTSVTIAGGSNVVMLNVGLTDINMSPFASQMLVLKLEGTADVYVSENLTINVGLNCPNNGVKLKMDIVFDDGYPEEIYWRLIDVNAGVIVLTSSAASSYGAYAGLTGGITIQECIPSGDYQLQVYDSYGDGGTSYAVSADGVQVITIAENSYTTSTSVNFSI
jgi:hypothetical protein